MTPAGTFVKEIWGGREGFLINNNSVVGGFGHVVSVMGYGGDVWRCWSSSLEVVPRVKPAVALRERRADGYVHVGIARGRKLFIIKAGCQEFHSAAKARAHWKKRQRHRQVHDRSDPFYRTEQAKRERAEDRELNKFSLRFVDKLERLSRKK